MILASALLCLAANVYHEARNQDTVGQFAVAQVTMNRAHHDPKRVCKVVAEPYQFSWLNGNTSYHNGSITIGPGLVPHEQAAWKKALRVARTTLNSNVKDLTGGATHYHTVSISLDWDKKMVRTARIGGHYFYRAA